MDEQNGWSSMMDIHIIKEAKSSKFACIIQLLATTSILELTMVILLMHTGICCTLIGIA
jgi:hypothetical protein